METKHCPICTNDLPVSEFGICRARRDGRNLYCKACIRQKVSKQRRAFKAYKAARKKYEQDVQCGLVEPVKAEPVVKLSPIQKFKQAIENGYRTQEEIRVETKLSIDTIGDALVNLLLWRHEIKSQLVNGERIYLLNVVKERFEAEQPVYQESLSLIDFARKNLGPVIRGDKRIQRVA